MRSKPSCLAVLPIALLSWMALANVVGCGKGNLSSAREQQTSHLRILVSLYNYAASTLKHAPASEAEFKQFIEKKGGPALERMQVASADELFVSERDGQPFVVIYGRPPKGHSTEVVAYEKTGLEGKRLVGFKLGMIQDLDDLRFQELVPDGAGAPQE